MLNEQAANASKQVQLAETVLFCIKHNLSYIPVKQDKTPQFTLLNDGKWKRYQHYRPTLEDGTAWAQQAEGLAVVTGALSGVIVLDIDEGGSSSISGKHLPVTPTVRTQNGGTHYYYKHPGYKIPSKTHILPNVDIRGDGGYALIPNSHKYEWYEGLSMGEIPLAEPPAWLLEILTEQGKRRGVVSNEYSLLTSPPRSTPSEVVNLGSLTGAKVQQWFTLELVARAFLDSVGLHSKQVGQSFKCIIPGHADSTPSASIYKGDRSGVYVYRDWHSQSKGEQYYTLAEVRAAFGYRELHKLQKSEHVTWSIRLLIELGFLQAAHVKHKPLPNNSRPTLIKVYEGFILLLGCKWLHTYGEPTPYSWSFVRAWCGVSERKAGEAIQELMLNGYIKIVDKQTFRGRPTSLFDINTD